MMRSAAIYDTHVHSNYSHDGRSSLEEYCRFIGQTKIKGIGFSEHVDFLPEAYGAGMFDYDSYIDEINGWKARGYDFAAGAELDYARRVEDDILDYLKRNPFDYTICSVHMIGGLSVSTGENLHLFMEQSTCLEVLEQYYRELECSVKVDWFDVIGHPGIYGRYLPQEHFCSGPTGKWVDEVEEELARLCALSGKIVEINTSGLCSPVGQTLASPAFLVKYKHHGGELISIGSDAHSTSQVGRGFGAALELVTELGFRYLTLPWDRERRIPIR